MGRLGAGDLFHDLLGGVGHKCVGVDILQETCGAKFSELQRFDKADRVRLTITNVTYQQQGLWRCSATNSIGGEERVAASPVVRLGVTGKPLPRYLKLSVSIF